MGNIRPFRRAVERHRGMPNVRIRRLGQEHAEAAAKEAQNRKKNEAEFLARKIARNIVPQQKAPRSPLRTLLTAARKIFGR